MSRARTIANFNTSAQGDIFYASAINTMSKLPKGTDNHILAMDGNVPNWEAAASGGIADPGSSTDNAILRWNGTSGDAVQDSTITVTDNGEMVNASQPAFHFKPTSSQTNMALAPSVVTLIFGTEIFDQNADFASNTFTAPVSGRYLLCVNLLYDGIDSDATYYTTGLITSNKSWVHSFFRSYHGWSADGEGMHQFSIVADMDASDTAYLRYYGVGGTAQVDLEASESSFSGCLIC